MKIGFDISQIGQAKAGCGFFADNVIKNLVKLAPPNNYSLYRLWGDGFHDPQYKKLKPVAENKRVHYFDRGDFDKERFFWKTKLTNFIEATTVPDIIHSNNFFCPDVKLANVKLVYTLYDLSFMVYPEYTTEANRLVCLRGVLNASLFADHIVSISEFSKAHFLRIFPHYPEQNITVTPLGTRFSNHLSEHKQYYRNINLLPERFVLSVGTLEPRKNHISLIKAYKNLKDEGHFNGIPLVLAGQPGWLSEPIDETIKNLNLESDVIKLGRVEDDELAWLYRNCLFMVYPSLFEGFGLPVLEAMSLGTAVISSNITSIPEIVADAGILINPHEIESLMKAMRELLIDAPKRSHFKKIAPERAAEFSWNKTAQAVLNVYKNLYKKQ